MVSYPPSIQKLINLFTKFPTVGPRTAARFVFYLMRLSKTEIQEITQSILNFKESIKLCDFCFNPFDFARRSLGEGETPINLCSICQNPSRDKTLLCILEKETDLTSIEKTKIYKGLYFILGGNVLKNLRTEELLKRIKNPEKFGISGDQFKEIIIAINPTTEGEATTLYLERLLKPLGKKITRLGRGLPLGAELEYADEETLGSALEGRK